MNSYRRASAVVITALLVGVSGCWNPAPEKYPSITYFNATNVDADNFIHPTISVSNGTDNAGNTVKGTSMLTWQTRLADKVEITRTDMNTGKLTVVATFNSGDKTSCTGINPLATNSDCVKDGELQVTPPGGAQVLYNIRAMAGQGRCDRDKVLHNLLYPSECNDLATDFSGILTPFPAVTTPPSLVTLTVEGGKTTVAPNTAITVDYTAQNVAGGLKIGVETTDSSGKGTFNECGTDPTATPTPLCLYDAADFDANGNLLPTGKVTLTVTATTEVTAVAANGAMDSDGSIDAGTTGPSTVTITVPGTPAVSAFTATPTTVPAGATGTTVTLDWTVASADTVAVTSDSTSTGTVTGLSGCTAVDATTGKGTCDVTISGNDGDMVKLDLVASNSQTGQTSPPSMVTVNVMATPAPTLTANPADIVSGDNVDLTWTATGATSVTISDGTNTIVDTGAATPTQCGTGSAAHACKADGDTFTVSNVTATTTWTLTATNAAGTGTATATATVHTAGAAITSVTVDGNDALGTTPVMATADTATLAWTATDAMDGALAAAPASSAGTPYDCTTVAAGNWTAVSGFQFATGTFGLTGLTGDMCYQLSATGYGTLGNDSKTFEVQRQVKVSTVSVNGTDVTASNTANVTPATPPGTAPAKIDITASYATANWAMYVTPKTAAQTCDAATYPGAPDGNGAMTAGAASYTIPDITVATCVKIMVTHPADTTRSDTYFLTITAN